MHSITFALVQDGQMVPGTNVIRQVQLLPMLSGNEASTRELLTTRPRSTLMIAETFVVNLAKETALLSSIKSEIFAKSQGLLHNVNVVRAVDLGWNSTGNAKDTLLELVTHGKLRREDYEEILRKERLHVRVEAIELTRGGVGCAMSHIHIWEQIAKSDNVKGEKYYVVLEDDVYVTHDFDIKFQRYISEVPDKFDIIYLGTQYYVKYANLYRTSVTTHHGEHEINSDLPHVKRVLGDHYGTFGYIVSGSGAKKLLANVYPLTQQIDSYIISRTRGTNGADSDGLDVYMFFPHLVYELKSLHKSTVQQFL